MTPFMSPRQDESIATKTLQDGRSGIADVVCGDDHCVVGARGDQLHSSYSAAEARHFDTRLRGDLRGVIYDLGALAGHRQSASPPQLARVQI